MIQIKRGAATVATVNPLSSSNMTKAVMGDEQITLVWEAPAFVSYYLGDYITFEGANWTLNKLPTVKKLSSKTWQYNAVFQSTKYELIKAMYLLFDNTDTLPSGEFPLTGTANTFMELLVANLNRVAGSAVWNVGQVIENTDYKNLTFSNEDCLSVLARLASEFDTEYHVHNHIIHLKKISTEREITLQYGSTLYDIERSSVDSSDVVTRLYPFGSTKNLASNYRGGNSPLRLPVANGNYIESNVNLYGIIEQSKTFDDIYPRLSSGGAGVITSVGDKFTFYDSQLDFNVNDYLLDGTTAKVRFNTGECAGYDFEIALYNHTAKKFVIIANTQENDFTLPTADLKPAVGDKYVLLDIIMPDVPYLDNAENELLAAAQEWLITDKNSTPKVAYKTTFSAIYAKQNLQNVECGDTVTVYDADMGINEQIRIIKLQKGLTDFWTVQFDLSNTVTATRLERIEGNMAAVENTVIVTNQRVNRNNLRAYQNTKELREMVFDPDGYFDAENIKPLSIETSMLSVGAKSQSFQLSSLLQPNYAGNPQVLQWSTGLLTHFTIVDDAIKEWTISQGSITITGDNQSTALYIYARCSRAGTTGDIYLSSTATKFDADATYYFFLLGVLHTPISSVRGISLTYGQTTINGQFIKTGKISSPSGNVYFDLDKDNGEGEIAGNIKFRAADNSLKSVEQAIDEMEVGGVNLFLNSQFKTSNSWIGLNQILNDGVYNYITATASWNNRQDVNVVVGDYTFSAYVKNISGADSVMRIKFDVGNSDGIITVLATQNSWTRISVKINANISTQEHIYIRTISGSILVALPKVEKGNKATDWSPAPEDVQKVLDDMSSDNKLTAQEKSVALKEWQAIQGEYTRLSTLATQLGVTNTLSTPYTNLANYINPLLSNMGVTSDIVGSTFRSYFTAYYNASTDLQNALTSQVQSNISNLVVGGENLIINSNFTCADEVGNNYLFTVLKGSTSTSAVSPSTYLTNGKTYVFTADKIEKLSGSATGVTLVLYDFVALANTSNLNQVLNLSTSRQTKVFTVPATGNWSLIIYCGISGATQYNSIKYTGLMCQEGNKPTTYKPATEYLTSAYKASTNVQGGVVQTAILMLRNLAEQVTAGISGLGGDNVINWGAGTYQQAIDDAAKAFGAAMTTAFLNKENGGGHLAFGKIAWDNAGQLMVDALIKATAGKIGGLDIFANSLKSASMSFSETPVETLASLISPSSVSISQQSSWLVGSTNGNAVAYSQNLVIPVDSQIRFMASATPYVDGLDKRWSVTVQQVGGATVFSQSGNGSISSQLFSVNVPAGTYIIRSSAMCILQIGQVAYSEASITGESTSSIYAYGYNYQTKIGNNGFYSFWDVLKFIYYSSTQGLVVRGSTDIPAGLGGASINSGGGMVASSNWGKITGSDKISRSTNNYTITHNIGDTNYSVQIIPGNSTPGTIYYSSKQSNTIVVTCAGAFDFVLIRTK